MKKILQAMVGVVLSVLAFQRASAAEPTWNYTVQVSATVQESPARITLSWPQDTSGSQTGYTVYRKSLSGTDWGSGTTLPASATSYVDNNVTVGSAYEYQIVKSAGGYTGYGYIYAGIKAPLVDSRGKVVLVVDSTHAGSLASELTRLQQDLVGDGWTVARHDVSRNDSPANVKNLIRSAYNADPANVKAVFLFGRVPVPYSGNIVPDGHYPDHQGAWPADAYYGDMDGSWTDNSVSSTGASDARNRNVPGDGKFDQSEMPSAIELQVGRVDLANMPGRRVWGGPATFPSEVELLRQYLNKDHNFRHKRMNAPVRAVIHDSFGTRGGEAFAASGYRSFGPLVGASQVVNIDPKGQWIPHLAGNNYLWAYGCGAGSYSTIGGLGNTGQYQDGTTIEVVENDIKAVFTMLFGSWLGDWDSEDNIMRAVLATRSMGLACSWSGRPHWFYHHVGLGEPIGYAAKIAQNNTGLYRTQVNSSSRNIHIALMGDPTLRIHPVASPANVSSSGSTLTWSASSDANAGYHVYRASSANGPFTRLTGSPIAGTSYTDNNGAGTFTYMVRAIKLESTPSGTYYNASQGAFAGGTGGGGGGDTTPPSVSITTPSGGATVSGGAVAISANASDNTGVVGVQFKVDGSNLGGEDTSSPYSVSWNSTSLANGSHTITAVACDAAGNQTTSTPTTVNVNNGGGTTSNPPPTGAWVDDAVPTGGQANGEGGDTWNWISSNPTPFSGSLAHQSAIAQGMHQHFFDWATATLTVNPGDSLYAYVYLDPANPPSELMLQWKTDTSWDHRAYWGANLITYGTDGTAGRRYMGPLPPTGQWFRLTVPASQVDLEGSQLRGMAFTVFNGRATWDAAGAGSLSPTPDTTPPTVVLTSPASSSVAAGTVLSVAANATDNVGVAGVQFRVDSASLSAEDIQPPYAVSWNTVGAVGAHQLTAVSRDLAGNRATSAIVSVMVTNVGVPPGPTNPAPTSVVADVTLEAPKVGDHRLRILSPTVLELELVTRKEPDPAQPNPWNFVNASFQLNAPAPSEFTVTANGQNVAVQSVAFKRRPLYVPLYPRDLRLGSYLYLQLGSAIAEGQNVVVQNPGGTVIAPGMVFTNVASALRYSPAIHVNQEGYVPSFPKKAMVGYYLGNAGEMTIPTAGGFKIVNAQNGAQVYAGTLTLRRDVGYEYTPLPYQKVYQADFSDFRTPGEYRLVVPGLGASLPFMIDDGIAMGMTRAYALGLYHQRCGTSTEMPFTRHHHDECHMDPADVPMPAASFQFAWNKVAEKSGDYNQNLRHTAPQLKDPASQRYPFVKTGKIDVSKGHHDAGDYSKYTVNSAGLVHYLVFAVDSFPGVAALDNLGLPESGDGISDILQEAKWEADYLAKIQDTDGGFYFLVYPRDREYENNVTPDNGDPQVVWPKTTSATAAAVAALAQIASSPRFKQAYPAEAAMYLQKAQLGWQFLINAINQFGKDGAYQKITHYGNEFMHDDELAWAAAELFVATGDATYHQKLKEWYEPSSPATFRWGWWRLFEGYGRAARSYAFAARSGRRQAGQLDAAYLAKCEQQVVLCAEDQLTRSRDNAYGSSFPAETKRVLNSGWYFSTERAFDLAVGYQIQPRPEFLEAFVANMNYEMGCNPVNMTYVTGLGWKRQREIVHQHGQNDRQALPPSGIPLGNIQGMFAYQELYKSELHNMCFPDNSAATARYPLYDRWTDIHNVTTEFVIMDQARSLAGLAFFSTLTPAKSTPWKPVAGQITVQDEASVGGAVRATLATPGMDLNGARIVWEARDNEPAYGGTEYTFMPREFGPQWVEAEAQWPDGRRMFAVAQVYATNHLPVVNVTATTPSASEAGQVPGVFTFTRSGNINSPMTVNYKFSGTAAKWDDYKRPQGDIPESIVIPAGVLSAALTVVPVVDSLDESNETIILTIQTNTIFNVGLSGKATVTIVDAPTVRISRITRSLAGDVTVTWNSEAGKVYQVSYKNDLSEPTWRPLQSGITSAGSSTSWTDQSARTAPRRFYRIVTSN